jgi:hypothetical protein
VSVSGTLLAAAIGQVHNWRRDEEIRHESRVAEAARKGDSPPGSDDLPSASDAVSVRQVARILSGSGVDAWYPDADLQAEEINLVGLRLEQLLEAPEFELIRNEVIEIRWSTRPMLRRDLQSTEVLLGRPKVVSDQERMTWPAGEPPTFRLLLSLPAALLATEDELDRCLHGLLAAFGMSDGRPVLRKPDVVGFAVTLARFGATGIRECQAVAGAMRHPETQRRMLEYGFDSASGQGLLWAPRSARQLDLPDVN